MRMCDRGMVQQLDGEKSISKQAPVRDAGAVVATLQRHAIIDEIEATLANNGGHNSGGTW